MPKGRDESRTPDEPFAEFVPAVVAKTLEEARRYRELLEDHDIPAIIGDRENDKESPGKKKPRNRLGGMTQGVPVMVPEVLLDEASEIIADRQDCDDFVVATEENGPDEEDDDDLGLTETDQPPAAGLEDDDEDELEEDDDEDEDILEDDDDEDEEEDGADGKDLP